MQRICTSLSKQGYVVTLIGRKLKTSKPLPLFNFSTKRLFCWFHKGILFYIEYNIRLFIYLLWHRFDAYCAIDLDTIIPNYFASIIKGRKRVYDAHELFTEQKEIITRPFIHSVWLSIEKYFVPRFKQGYTVNNFIKEELNRRYKVQYEIIRNIPIKKEYHTTANTQQEKFIIYQGAVNEGRSFETLIPAMRYIDCRLIICGKGNFFEQTKQLITQYNVQDKVILKGYVSPSALDKLTPTALFGLTLFEKTGLNQFYSLANRFFDYMMAGIPQICVGYPEYKTINDKYQIALLVNDTDETTLVQAINKLLNDTTLYQQIKNNCLQARETLNWEMEEEKLIKFWHSVLDK
ncbi:MAG: glycosyltransferase [Chitinophagaceae bacterium]|nr:glycosyltransferase [Chitinophagaceae bacterium]MCW5905348.1 glycosyltransferase [Chitinophagaceae bacterium]